MIDFGLHNDDSVKKALFLCSWNINTYKCRYSVLYKPFASPEAWHNTICEILRLCYRPCLVATNVHVGGFCDLWVSGMSLYSTLGGCLPTRSSLWGTPLGVSGCSCGKLTSFFVGLSGSFFIGLVIVWRIGTGSVWWFIFFWGLFIFRSNRFYM